MKDRLRHLSGLLRAVWDFAWANRAWWFFPLVVVLLLVALLVAVGSMTTPFLYTLF